MLLTAALLATTITTSPPMLISPAPNMSLSAIRHIECDEGSGSGFIIGKNIVATALHVASLHNCIDGETGRPLKTYKTDEKNDFALMSGKLPDIIPMHYNCQPYKTGETYYSYGISSWHYESAVFGQYKMTAASGYTDDGFLVGNDNKRMAGMRMLTGYIIPGNSGGPITDLDGNVIGINNVSGRGMLGMSVLTDGYSYELKNTILCSKV